jgi:hypothetical protein
MRLCHSAWGWVETHWCLAVGMRCCIGLFSAAWKHRVVGTRGSLLVVGAW